MTLEQWHEMIYLQNVARMERDSFPGAMSDEQKSFAFQRNTTEAVVTHKTPENALNREIEPIEETIKRATGQDVVSISIYDPELDAKLRAVWGSWK